MMVVIGVIAILGAVVVPGFKKIYSDFKVMETFYFINTAMSAQRAFYLVRNEVPFEYNTGNSGEFEERMLPFFPRCWVTNSTFSSSTTNPSAGRNIRFYKLASHIKPYKATNPRFGIGNLSIYLAIPVDAEYAEELSNMCERKGYGLTKDDSLEKFWAIHLPERYNTKPTSSKDSGWWGSATSKWFR